jgi:molybdopterin synthase catalytic subunit
MPQQPSSAQVQVLYFGGLRERLSGRRQESVVIAGGTSVGQLVDRLRELHPALVGLLGIVKLAVNDVIALPAQPLHDGDVVALIPPVAGGADKAWLTDRPLDVNELLAKVTGPTQGGVVVFLGVVRDSNAGRDVSRLEYEAYPSMALKVLAEIVAQCEAVAPGVRLAVAHRSGSLAVGEIAVIVAASAPHRAPAFAAARLCMELIKTDAPIWKKEFARGGPVWIGLDSPAASIGPL